MFNISIGLETQVAQQLFNVPEVVSLVINHEFISLQPEIVAMINDAEFQYQNQYLLEGYFLQSLSGSTARGFEKLLESKLTSSNKETLGALYDALDDLRVSVRGKFTHTRGFRSF